MQSDSVSQAVTSAIPSVLVFKSLGPAIQVQLSSWVVYSPDVTLLDVGELQDLEP